MHVFFEHGLPHFGFPVPDSMPDVSDLFFMQMYLIWSGIVGAFTFVIYGIDKARAMVTDIRKRKRRIPEKVLLTLAFIGGAVGAAAGMLLFHHKTRKRKFGTLLPLAVILWLTGLLASVFLFGWYGTF